MKKILITSTDWGHGIIAKGLKEVIGKNHITEIVFVGVEPFSKVSYEFIYKYFPSFFKIVFGFSEIKILKKLFDAYVERSYKEKIKSAIKRQKPGIVVNTYFAFNSSFESLQSQYNFRFINVFADPWTFSRILISEAGENLTFDKYSLERLKILEPKAKGLPIGWFIEKKYYLAQNRSRKLARKKLGLNPNLFTLCVVSGSEGTFNIFKILSTFLNPRYKIQVIILCGNNFQMFNVVKTLKSLSEKIRGPKIIGVAYTQVMQDYLRASDLVVGKAGPNTMFQSVATLTPFFAISHISGQEDGNLKIIKRYRIGYVEENPRLATLKLKEIIENPKTLNKFQKNLKALSKYCQESEKKLLTLLKP